MNTERDELAALQTRISQIPEETVKAAAAALKRRLGNVLTGDDTEWEMDAYTVLTAAAPFIAAQAWDEGARAMFVDDPFKPTPPNPYRSEK